MLTFVVILVSILCVALAGYAWRKRRQLSEVENKLTDISERGVSMEKYQELQRRLAEALSCHAYQLQYNEYQLGLFKRWLMRVSHRASEQERLQIVQMIAEGREPPQLRIVHTEVEVVEDVEDDVVDDDKTHVWGG